MVYNLFDSKYFDVHVERSQMIGKTLAHYEILEKIGAGGMGEVYLARDPQLDREVAVKILPETVASDPERMARFQREAKTLAAVNHSGIATVFGLHEQDGTRFMAMELVPGLDLSNMISKQALPTGKALKYALQIAEALEAAHQRGIIHRDLKPQNLMVTPDGNIKVLDFGLARLSSPRSVGDEKASSPTITAALTQPGTIMGTPTYMSPEQVQGEDVDTRCDIWSFGAVLFEMLTGERAFGGKTVPETMYLVTQSDPDLNLLPASLPAGVRRLVCRCLVKEARKRLQSIGDARVILQEAIEGKLVPAESAMLPTKSRSGLALWVFLPVVALAAWFLKPQETPAPQPSARFELQLPDGQRLTHFYRRGLAISPDGKILAFVSGLTPTNPKAPAESSQIYLRPLDQWQARAIPGTKKGLQPFFSPDGQWLGFIRDGELLKVPTSGGEPSTICECNAEFGASWGPDGTIVFANTYGGLKKISSSGGAPTSCTELDLDAGEISHRLPQMLPDGKSVLFTALRHTGLGANWDIAQIFIQSLETGERKLLLDGAADAHYLPSGHLVFARNDRLMAIGFEISRWEVFGPEVTALEGVNRSIDTGNDWRETGIAQFSFSNTGVLVYASGSTFPEEKRKIVWVDRQGQEEILPIEPKQYLSVRVSPDGQNVLLTVWHSPRDTWIYNLSRQLLRRQTFDANQTFAVWGPKPDQFTFESHRGGRNAVYVKTVDSGPGLMEELPIRVPGRPLVGSWSPDGDSLVFVSTGEAGDDDISSFTRGGQVKPFLHSRFFEIFPEFSPDGQWVVYSSNESGSQEVFACTYPEPGRSIQVSRGGGSHPVWSRDGHEIIYRGPRDEGNFYSVRIKIEEGLLKPGAPVTLFPDKGYNLGNPIRSFDIGDDDRLLMIKSVSASTRLKVTENFFPTQIQVVQDWLSELEDMFLTEK